MVYKLLDASAVAVATTALGASLINTVFFLYYMKVFLNLYGLNDFYLNVAQTLFLVWNAINNPLFGCVQDVGCGKYSWKWLRDRRKVILYAGPVYSVTFILFWFPWTENCPEWLVGLHLLVALFTYDTLFTLVLSAFCGLFKEFSTDHHARVRVLVYSEFGTFLGTLAIFPLDKLSRNLENFAVFQAGCVILAIMSALCFMASGYFSPKEVAQIAERVEMEKLNESGESAKNHQISEETGETLNVKNSTLQAIKFSWQIIKERDFLCVVLANFCRITRIMASVNFSIIFVEALISPHGILKKESIELSMFYQLAGSLPRLTFVVLWPALHYLGAWTVNTTMSILSCVNCVVAYWIGRQNYVWLAAYFFLERSPLTVLLFTMNALITKPAQSIAPMIVVYFLSMANYTTFARSQQTNRQFPSISCDANSTQVMSNFSNVTISTYHTENERLTPEQESHLYDTMFAVATLFPLCCAVAELLLFLPYRLKFRHKNAQSSVQYSENVQPIAED